MTDRLDIERLLRELYAARVRGDLDGVCRAFTNDATLQIAGAGNVSPIGVKSSGVVQFRSLLGLLIKSFKLSEQTILSIIVDGEKAAVLATMADTAPKDLAVMEALMGAADSISSDGEHARVLMDALNAGTLSKESVVLVIHSAEKISSDGEKARVLARAAQRYSNDPLVAAALRAAAKSIQSDGEYRKVMNALDRGNSL